MRTRVAEDAEIQILYARAWEIRNREPRLPWDRIASRLGVGVSTLARWRSELGPPQSETSIRDKERQSEPVDAPILAAMGAKLVTFAIPQTVYDRLASQAAAADREVDQHLRRLVRLAVESAEKMGATP